MMKRQRQFVIAVPLVVLLVAVLLAGWQFLQPQHAKAATPYNAELLMIHGWSDSCGGAFDYSNNPNYTNPSGRIYDSSKPFAAIDTWSYFNTQGWAAHIDKVGYYDSSHESGCNHNANSQFSGQCSSLAGSDTYTNDPIRHLGCEMAWYIFHNYTQLNQPVYVLAHSMGGLVIRDAIAESHANNAPFPSSPIDVQKVVTVATPHGGLWGDYATNAQNLGGNVEEVREMTVGSPFMNMIASMQKPQGKSGTYWALMASSVKGIHDLSDPNCDIAAPIAALASCGAEQNSANQPYPDGDGLVQADSQLSMQADYKILYGVGIYTTDLLGVNGSVYTAGVSYSHEADSCGTIILNITGCLESPFYLNDNTTGQTSAWICSSGCNAGTSGGGGIADVHVVDSNHNALPAQPAAYSLAELLSFLPKPSPPPTPTPTNTPVTTCAATIETDNIEPGGTYTDNRGNTWHVYYDIKRDSVTNKPCQMRVVVRIFNPFPDGTWSGTVDVLATRNGVLLSSSIGKVSGSCTYQYHFVWRGPWFNASPGNYFIDDEEYNGSNPYARAFATFTI